MGGRGGWGTRGGGGAKEGAVWRKCSRKSLSSPACSNKTEEAEEDEEEAEANCHL